MQHCPTVSNQYQCCSKEQEQTRKMLSKQLMYDMQEQLTIVYD